MQAVDTKGKAGGTEGGGGDTYSSCAAVSNSGCSSAAGGVAGAVGIGGGGGGGGGSEAKPHGYLISPSHARPDQDAAQLRWREALEQMGGGVEENSH